MRSRVLVVGLLLVVAASAGTIPLTPAHWNVLYDGYGQVTWNSNETVSFAPQKNDAGTSAVLVLSLAKARDFDLAINATTVSQLKTTPEKWEVFWVMFNYVQIGNGTSNDKKTNYFILKPNGCELGTAYGDLGQNFTATTSTPTLALGTPYQYTITKRGYHLTVAIDGVSVLGATYDHTGLYDQEGVIGLYCEDAAVQVTSVVLTSHDPAATGSAASALTPSFRLFSAVFLVPKNNLAQRGLEPQLSLLTRAIPMGRSEQ